MSIASEVTALQNNLQAAKTAVTTKGGTVGNTGLAGLASEIATIPSGGGEQYIAPYGNVEYCKYVVQWTFDAYGSPGELSVVIDNTSLFDQFVQDNQPNSDSLQIEYQGNSWIYYSQELGQMYQWYSDYEVLQNTGLKITWNDYGEQRQFGQIYGYRGMTVDPNTPAGILYIRTAEDFASLGNSGDQNTLYDIPVKAFTKVIVGPSVQSIPNYFLNYAYNLEEVDMSKATSVSSIGTYFLANSSKVNNDIAIPSGVTKINNYFLYRCSSFNSNITIPNTVTEIGDSFLDVLGINGTFNKPLVIPNSVTKIGSRFIAGQTVFNSDLTLPNGSLSIGTYFMNGCNSFAKKLVIKSGYSVAPGYFMYECRKLSELQVDGSLNGSANKDYALSSYYSTYPMYTTGIKLTGSNRSAWLTALPNRTARPYRKLINGGA